MKNLHEIVRSGIDLTQSSFHLIINTKRARKKYAAMSKRRRINYEKSVALYSNALFLKDLLAERLRSKLLFEQKLSALNVDTARQEIINICKKMTVSPFANTQTIQVERDGDMLVVSGERIPALMEFSAKVIYK